MGDEGYAKRVNKQFALANYATDIIRKSPHLNLIIEPEFLNICFEVKGIDAKKICNTLYKEGKILVGYGSRSKKSFIRLITVNPEMSELDIDNFFDEIEKISKNGNK